MAGSLTLREIHPDRRSISRLQRVYDRADILTILHACPTDIFFDVLAALNKGGADDLDRVISNILRPTAVPGFRRPELSDDEWKQFRQAVGEVERTRTSVEVEL